MRRARADLRFEDPEPCEPLDGVMSFSPAAWLSANQPTPKFQPGERRLQWQPGGWSSTLQAFLRSGLPASAPSTRPACVIQPPAMETYAHSWWKLPDLSYLSIGDRRIQTREQGYIFAPFRASGFPLSGRAVGAGQSSPGGTGYQPVPGGNLPPGSALLHLSCSSPAQGMFCSGVILGGLVACSTQSSAGGAKNAK
jgi:hypothetical protein